MFWGEQVEAAELCPEYMQDQGFAMGSAFTREEDKYRSGDGGTIVGWQRMNRTEGKHWRHSAVDTIRCESY